MFSVAPRQHRMPSWSSITWFTFASQLVYSTDYGVVNDVKTSYLRWTIDSILLMTCRFSLYDGFYRSIYIYLPTYLQNDKLQYVIQWFSDGVRIYSGILGFCLLASYRQALFRTCDRGSLMSGKAVLSWDLTRTNLKLPTVLIYICRREN